MQRRLGGARRGTKRTFGNPLFNQSDDQQTFLNMQQILTLEQMLHTHPAMVSARNVLTTQVLSAGITLKRDGEPVDLKPAFRNHLNEYWIPFARQVIDSFLVSGMCVVSYEEMDATMHSRLSSLQTKGPKRKRKEEEALKKKNGKDVKTEEDHQIMSIVPVVAPFSTYKMAMRFGGRAGYLREYVVYPLSIAGGSEIDEEVRIFVRQPPDHRGNVNSPIASAFELASFVDSLVEHSLVAEGGRSKPTLVTQTRKAQGQSSLNPTDMFFDGESRDIAYDAQNAENRAAAQALQIQARICKMVNEVQNRPFSAEASSSRAGIQNEERRAYSADVASRTFTLPTDQELAQAQIPQTRGDLTELIRLSVDQMCSAMGVPSSLLFESRYASRGQEQLLLLNETVQQFAQHTNMVLTRAYLDCYEGDGEFDVELVTATRPISSIDNLKDLYTCGLVDFEAAAPVALHGMGLSATDIEAAMERRRELEQSNAAMGVGPMITGSTLFADDSNARPGAPAPGSRGGGSRDGGGGGAGGERAEAAAVYRGGHQPRGSAPRRPQ